MKAISIQQPHTELILSGKKNREYRTWNTKVRGTVLIHCSKQLDKKAIEQLGISSNNLPKGSICGKVDIIGVEKYGEKDYGWILANPKKFKNPKPVKGMLGFFNV